MSLKPPQDPTTAAPNAPLTIDTGTSPSTTLTLIRNYATNSNVLVLQNEVVGGRSNLVFRDETDTDQARLVAHNADDPGSSTAGFRIYTLRDTPRADGNMYENHFLVEGATDFGVVATFGATLRVDTHDTDGALHTDQTGVLVQRSPGDYANESTEFLRSRASSVGSNYIHRDLAAADTAGPLLRILNDNSSDDQVAVRITQDCSQGALLIENTTTGPALIIQQGYQEFTEQTDPTGPAADKLRIYAKDQGTGKTILAQRSGSGIEHLYGWLVGSATWDPAATAATQGAEVSTTVTVTGAAVGDPVIVSHSAFSGLAAVLVGQVTSTNTVTVRLINTTAVAVDLATGTLTATVIKVR